jgi:hypothetical protein
MNSRARWLPLAVTAAVLIGGCGSSHGRGGGGLASKPARAILTAAYSSVAHVKSVHMAGRGLLGNQTVSFDVDVVPGRGWEGSISEGGRSAEFVSLGTRAYVKAGAAFWEHHLGAAAAHSLEGRWIEEPATGQFKFASQLTNLKSFLEPLIPPGSEKVVNTGARVIDGQRVIGVHDQRNGTLYVASAGRPYPIQVEQPGTGGGRVTFSGFNRPVTINAPAVAAGAPDALARAMVGYLSTSLSRYGDGWRRIGTARSRTSCSRLVPGRPARSISPYFEYRGRLEVDFGVYVYRDQSAASKALRAMGGERDEACRARSYLASFEKQNARVAKQHRYSFIGRPEIVPSKTKQDWHPARMTTAIVLPVTYRGRAFRFYLDEATAQNGRFIVWFSSTATASELSWDEKTVSQFTQTLSAG